MADIHLQGVRKVFDKTVAVDDVELHIADGEFMVLLGPSGCGKTTLLRLLAGLEYPNGGRVRIGDADVTDLPPRKRDLAMVFQSYAVFPHLKVFDNIAFGLRMRKLDRAGVRQRVERAAALVELSELLGRYPSQLSGGQRQRVAVARAIVMEPAVLLMDEPLSNLDALLRLTFRAQLKELVAELKTTTIYVTHDQVEALSLGDRIAVMDRGRVVQCDAPGTVYSEPASQFVGAFIGNPPMNFVNGRVHRNDGDRRRPRPRGRRPARRRTGRGGAGRHPGREHPHRGRAVPRRAGGPHPGRRAARLAPADHRRRGRAVDQGLGAGRLPGPPEPGPVAPLRPGQGAAVPPGLTPSPGGPATEEEAHGRIPAQHRARHGRRPRRARHGLLREPDQPDAVDRPTGRRGDARRARGARRVRGGPPAQWELFDLERDPFELQSVHDDPGYAAVRRQLTLELTRVQAEVGDRPWRADVSIDL
jgi:ABC-type sugar transport system ATPase subunit